MKSRPGKVPGLLSLIPFQTPGSDMQDRDVTRDELEHQVVTNQCHVSGRQCDEKSEKPALGSAVRLAGKISGLGFRESQWLLDNGGKFVQVTELLYRIAEHANGEHTLQEIAAKVTDATEWSLEAADVEYLIQGKLAPLGLMENGSAAVDSPNASPLAINLKVKTLGPGRIEPITSVLHWLCNGFVVALTVGAAAAAHWWLYLHHGLSSSIQDVIYTPGGLLFALAILLLAAAFHEFGHASALRHHGGRVGNMGAAFYLIYPVLYTDVSDNYRLSRWARVSTDLGGVYFHILFSLALFGAYFASHRELLLFPVLLIDLAIIEQFIPFARLDGYWLLCDLTGIPDFFSQMLPFLRTLLPQKFAMRLDAVSGDGRHDKLPDMKTWVKAAFATYILVTVPLLVYLFVRMIISLPRLVSEMLTGLHLQIQLLHAVEIRHDPLTAALIILQIVLLTLPVPATVYFLWITMKPPLDRFLDWSSRSPRQAFTRTAATLACCGMVGAFIMVPSLRPFHRVATGPRHVQQLLQAARQATANLNSLTADLEGGMGEDHYTGKLMLRRPNFVRMEINGTEGLGNSLLISDGSTATTYFPETNEFAQSEPGKRGQFIQSTVVNEVEQFFNPDSLGRGTQLDYIGHRISDGTEYDVVRSHVPGSEEEVTYFIGLSDRLIHRAVAQKPLSDQPGAWVLLRNVKTNVDLDASAFAWSLPQTAKQVQLPAGFRLPSK
jgi:putative peptide zinc metalloprotease protein